MHKLSNSCVITGKMANICYLIDFGISKRYECGIGKHINYEEVFPYHVKPFASLNKLRGLHYIITFQFQVI